MDRARRTVVEWGESDFRFRRIAVNWSSEIDPPNLPLEWTFRRKFYRNICPSKSCLMKHLKWIALLCLFTCAQVRAASFDCDKAHSSIEKLLCSNDELSDLDNQLGEAYVTALQRMRTDGGKRLQQEQLQWLRSVRNQCVDSTCLLNVYRRRVNELDPFADKQLSCEEMRKLPERIFSDGIDLGSGSGSPIEVDYRCPESLSQQKFMQKLLGLTEQIRGDAGPQICSGTIVHALWRYYHFSLAAAGFAPQTLSKVSAAVAGDLNWSTFARTDESIKETQVFLYLKQWSERSRFNLERYSDFTAEFDRVLPQLTQHYKTKHKLPRADAQTAAKNALMLLVQRAAGSFPSSELTTESTLVQLVRDEQVTSIDIQRALSDGNRDLGPYSEFDLYQALNVALLHNRSQQIVSSLAENLSPEAIQFQADGKEPLLSFAIGNQQSLEYLLGRKVPVNAANNFGKTALFYAIGLSNHNAVETLLKAGANVNQAYKSAKELRPNDDECVYPGLSHTRRTPLMHAAQNSDLQMLQLLVKAGAQLSAVDDLGFNALDYAAREKNRENAIYLRSIGLELGAPKYTSDVDSTVREQKIQTRLSIDGYVAKLLVAPGRPDILVASVTPWDSILAEDKHGLYLISIADPEHPKIVSNFPSVLPNDFAISPDGKRAYLIELAHDKAAPGKRFGLSIIDTTNPKMLLLVEQIEGDFMTMHLSPDGKYLYLQERRLKPEFSRGLQVYSTGADGARLGCSNPFGKVAGWGPVFAYSFTSFPDEPLLMIQDRSRGLILFDVKDPCAPKRLAEVRAENVSGPLFGGANRTIVSGSGGLQKFRVADTLMRVTGYEASVRAFHVNQKTDSSTAVVGRDVAVFRTNPSGQFVLTDRFRLDSDDVGSIWQTNSGHIYMGWKGGLGVGTVPGE